MDAEELITVMGRDKKVVDDGLTFILDGPRGLEVVSGIPAALVRETLQESGPGIGV